MKIKQQYLSTLFLNSLCFSLLSCKIFLLAQEKKKWKDNEQRMSHASLQNGIYCYLLKAKEN